MTERMSGQKKYNHVTERFDDYYEQVESLAASRLDIASAFRQAMGEVADELGEEYAADFRQRLITDQVGGGWPNPDLLAELKERNPAGMENFLDRFETISAQQRLAYTAELDELIASMRADGVHTDAQSDPPSKENLRLRALTRATLRGFKTIHL